MGNKAGLLENTPRVILVTPKENPMVRGEPKDKDILKYGREMGEEINTSISEHALNKAYQTCLWKMVVKYE